MKRKLPLSTKLLFAGSLTTAAILLAMLPFNVGGCGVGGIDVGNAVGGITTLGKSASLDKKEPEIGESVALQVTNRYPLYQDKNLTRYVTLVGRTVGASSSNPALKYYFGILDTPQANAFSAPHGFVFITRGALMRMKDESELAGVLGHEIGHICKQHGLRAVQSAATKQGLTQLAGSVTNIGQFANVVDAGGDVVLNTGFSEPQEDEADHEGVKFMAAAGYDPHGYLHFLQRIAAEQGKAGDKPFGTHPGMSDRVKRIQDQINKMNNPTGQTLADRFAANVTLR